LSPETLHVFYAPGSLLALTRCGWRGSLGQTRRYAVAPATGEGWQAPLDSLVAALQEFKPQRVRLVLSHHFVQFRVLPWRDDLSSDADYQALAGLEFANAFGAMAESWTTALSDEAPGQPRVAAAMASGLLTALGETIAGAGARLLALRPYLTVAADVGGRQGRGAGWQWRVLHEPGRVCVAVRQAGAWRWLRHVRVGDDWVAGLGALLDSEALLGGLEVPAAGVQVFAPGATPDTLSALRAGGYELLEPRDEAGFAASRDGAFAPAWLG
jgi:hypothetical protein